jgi:hypothetical protein
MIKLVRKSSLLSLEINFVLLMPESLVAQLRASAGATAATVAVPEQLQLKFQVSQLQEELNVEKLRSKRAVNDALDSKGHVRVVVRIRAPTQQELARFALTTVGYLSFYPIVTLV